MINLFAIPAGDASISYLQQLFGNVSGVLCPAGGASCAGDINILSTMFKTFNSIILVIAVLLLIYVTIIAVVGTAHEGEFMGKKLNNIWIPIRAVLGIALLVPTGAGYCGIQIIMMWVIVQGIGAANTVWFTALSYINVVGSPYVQAKVPLDASANHAFTGLFQGVACTISNGGTIPKFNEDASSYDLGGCGSLTYCNKNVDCAGAQSNSLKCTACKAQIAILPQIIDVLAGIGAEFVKADKSYQVFFDESWNRENNSEWRWIYNYCASVGIAADQCCVTGGGGTCKAPAWKEGSSLLYSDNDTGTTQSASPGAVKKIYWPFWPRLQPALGQDVNFIKVAVGYYQESANNAMSSYVQEQADAGNVSGNLSGPLAAFATPVMDVAKTKGWIFAGALYYQLANLNSKRAYDSKTDLTWNPGKLQQGTRNNLLAAGFLASAAGGDTSAGGTGMTGAGDIDKLQKDFNQSVTSSFVENVSNEGQVNPLMMLQLFGTLMLILVQVAVVLVIAIILTAGIASSISAFGLGTGITNPLSNAAIIEAMFLIPLFWLAMGLLTSIGATLSIYTPLLPFIYFTFGAIAWMISTVEAMVAGPLVALGIISPSGQHEIMGKAEPALLLLFGIFLRPTLMIFGLVIAMLLAIAVCYLINETFAYVIINWLFPLPNPLTLIFMLVAYVSLILAALNKCFSVINLIPQQTMRWISGQGDAVETPTDAIKGGIDATSGKVGGITGEGAEQRAKQAGQAAASEQAKGAKQAKKDDKGKGITGS